MWLSVVVFLSYAAIASLAIYPAIIHGPARVLQGSGVGDLSQEVWFVEFIPWAILHGHSPFITNWINAPYGANLLENTSMVLPSILASPITLIFGPIAGFNFLMVASFALSAFAMYFVASRWVQWRPAAYFAGLLYGFSPLLVGQGLGHVFLLFDPFPPLILYALYRAFIAKNSRPVLYGIWLGLLAAGQFFVSTEVLAALGVMGVAGAVLSVILFRKELRQIFQRALRVASGAVVAFAVPCLVPLLLLFYGRGHYNGPAQSVTAISVFKSDLLSAVVPNGLQLIRPAFLEPPYADFAEADLYLGIPLVAFLLISFILMRRRLGVQLFACLAVIAWVLSLGARLRVDRHDTTFRLPFTVLVHLPFTDSFVASRLSLFVYLFVAPIFALGLDHAWKALSKKRSFALSSLVAIAVGVVALIPLIPKWPYGEGTLFVPGFITSAAERDIPPGSTVVTYPFPNIPTTTPMSWQALDAMRYKLAGGEMITPGADRRATFTGGTSKLSQLSSLAYTGTFPIVTSAEIEEVRLDLKAYGAETVIVAPMGEDADAMRALYADAIGTPGQNFEGTYVWFKVGSSLALPERSA
jgi:hypothetical protein